MAIIAYDENFQLLQNLTKIRETQKIEESCVINHTRNGITININPHEALTYITQHIYWEVILRGNVINSHNFISFWECVCCNDGWHHVVNALFSVHSAFSSRIHMVRLGLDHFALVDTSLLRGYPHHTHTIIHNAQSCCGRLAPEDVYRCTAMKSGCAILGKWLWTCFGVWDVTPRTWHDPHVSNLHSEMMTWLCFTFLHHIFKVIRL